MNSDNQETTKALRARRKAEQIGLFGHGNNPAPNEAPQETPLKPYIDVPTRHEETPPKPYISAPARNEDSSSSNEILDYLESIKTRKLLILFVAFAGAVYGVLSLIPEPPIYDAVTTLELQGFNEHFMNMNQVDPQAGTGNYSADHLNLSTQLRIIESSSIRNPVLQTLERETTPVVRPPSTMMGRLRSRYGSGATHDPLEFTRNALLMAAGSLQAQSMAGTRILTISTESTSPEIAAAFVNAVAAEYVTQSMQQRTSNAQKTMQWLEGQVEETKVKLEQSQNELQDFVRKSGALFVADQDTVARTNVKALQTQLAASQMDLIAKKAKYEMVMKSAPEALPNLLGDATLRDYQNKLFDLTRQRDLLLVTLTPQHAKVVALNTQIASLENGLVKERDNELARIRSEYDAAQRAQSMLESAYRGQSGTVLSQSDKAVEYAAKSRETEILKLYLNGLLAKNNEASVAAAIQTTPVRVIDSAKPADYPIKPNSFSRVSYSTMMGLGLGCLLAVARGKYLKNRSAKKFASPGHSSLLLNVPELGVIPSASYGLKKKNWWLLPLKKRSEQHLLANGAPAETAVAGELELIGPHDSPSLLADSFRLMVASITLMNKRTGSQAILVTSPGPAEGKTTLVSNLAIVMAETGRRVLLVDMDLRKPRLHHLFNVDNTRGFTDLINTDIPLTYASVEQFIQPTKFSGVSILPSGAMLDIKGINQLFYSPRVTSFLGIMRKKVDVILIDTPPMIHFSEARLMASMADGVILVLRSGATDRQTALTCQQRLAEDGTNLLGTILNDWRPENETTYHGYYSYYRQHEQEKQ